MTIKEFRLSQGLSQPKLAKAIGVGVSTIGGYETGRINPSDKVVAKIKEVFGVNLADPAPTAPAPADPAPAPAPAAPFVEEKGEAPAAKPKRGRKKKEADVDAMSAPAPVAEEKVEKAEEPPVKPKRGRRKAAPAEPAPLETVPAETIPEPAPVETVPVVEEKVEETPAPTVIIQSNMGGEINVVDIIAKVGNVDTIYVKPEDNRAYWVKGDQNGAVELW